MTSMISSTGLPRPKSQSAMEYLMTYGWSVLVIALVVVGLFVAGVFNTNNTPKQYPGSCTVLRPNGPGTISPISLQGTCNNGEPEYVVNISSLTFITGTNMIGAGTELSVSTWIKPASSGAVIFTDTSAGATCPVLQVDVQPNGIPEIIETHYLWSPSSGPALTYNSWNFVSASMNDGLISTISVNGNVITGTATNNHNSCGAFGGTYTYKLANAMTGSLADMQVYSSALGANSMKAIYVEGIGGAPLDLTHLLGWWPMNGDVNDYSGNDDNATAQNAVFTQTWQNTYKAP